MDAAGVIAQYVMDGDQPLTADSNGNTTYYLYGLGAIGEKTTDWAYPLPDGVNTPRQLSDLTGEITLSARYTPWGDTLETYGIGNFAFGYFGGVMDAATGLLYVGNGQYYDPATGRFLTRYAKPNNSNPYVPWDPTGAMLAPLGVLALVYRRRKKGGKAGMLLVLLIVGITVGMSVASCGNLPAGEATATIVSAPGVPVAVATATFSNGMTLTGTLPASNGTPTNVLGVPCQVAETPTPIGTPDPGLDAKLRITLHPDLESLGMADYMNTEDDAVLLARVAIGEALEGDTAVTRTEKELIMWIVRIHAATNYSTYMAPFYTIPPVPTTLKTALFAPNQFLAMKALISSWSWVVDEGELHESHCRTIPVRMGNPCTDLDMQRLRDAYHLAQEVLSKDISQAPDAIKGFDSYWAVDASANQCSTFELQQNWQYQRPSMTNGGSRFFDCGFIDNYWLFHDYTQQNGWLPPEGTPTP